MTVLLLVIAILALLWAVARFHLQGEDLITHLGTEYYD